MTATLALGVGQAHREVLDRFRAALGFGSVTGPTGNVGTRMYAYRVHGFERVQAVFAMLWPWLGSIKRRQIMAVLEDAIDYSPRQKRRSFSKAALREVRALLAAGITQAEIARRYACEPQRINAIARGRSYKVTPCESTS